MEELVGHESTLLFLAASSYCMWQLSSYGLEKNDVIAFKSTSIILLILIGLYAFREYIPGIGVITLAIFAIAGLFLFSVIPGPRFKISVPLNRRRRLVFELVGVLLSTVVIMGIWQHA